MTNINDNYCRYLKNTFESEGVIPALTLLADDFRRQKHYHDLFEVLQTKARVALGLPLNSNIGEKLTAEQKTQLHEKLILISREVGVLFAEASKLREAWTYLEKVNDPELVESLLEATEITDDNFNEIIEITIIHRVSPVKGFELFLHRFGILYSVSMYQSTCHKYDFTTRHAVVTLIIEYAYHELREHLAVVLKGNENLVYNANTLMEIKEVAGEQLLEIGFMIPTRLIIPVFRISRFLQDTKALGRLSEIAEFARFFGQMLNPDYYMIEAPFEDAYYSYFLFFRALCAEDTESYEVTSAIEYFDQKSVEAMENNHGQTCHLVLIDLLYRLGKIEQALSISLERLPDHSGTTAGDIVLPSMAEMAKECNNFQLLQDHYATQGDSYRFLLSLLQESKS